jgi:hypothetical protein
MVRGEQCAGLGNGYVHRASARKGVDDDEARDPFGDTILPASIIEPLPGLECYWPRRGSASSRISVRFAYTDRDRRVARDHRVIIHSNRNRTVRRVRFGQDLVWSKSNRFGRLGYRFWQRRSLPLGVPTKRAGIARSIVSSSESSGLPCSAPSPSAFPYSAGQPWRNTYSKASGLSSAFNSWASLRNAYDCAAGVIFFSSTAQFPNQVRATFVNKPMPPRAS